MKFFPSRTTFLQIGSLTIQWYAVLILTGAFIAYYFSKKNLKEYKNIDVNDFFDDVFIWMLWGGVIGARLWFCAFYNFDFYLHNPIEIIKVWDGGVAFHGAFAGGLIAAVLLCKKRNVSFIKFCDAVIPTVLFAQGLGRWGNFINQECHGGEVPATYFDGILSFLKQGMYINGHYYEPLFFYESTLCILGWFIIHFILRKRQNRRGDLAYCYLLWYGVIRFFIEGRRTDSLYLGNIRMAQLTSVVFVVIGTLGYLGAFRKLTRNKPTIIFDFDGTLIDTSASIFEAYRACFEKYSDVSKFTDEVKNEVLGPALKTMFPKYFPDYDYDTLYETYHNRQSEVSKDLDHPTTGAMETLKKLHEQGYKIGIVSTRTSQGINNLLAQTNMGEYIDDICGLKDVENLKPDPEGIHKLINKNHWHKDCVMIGDSLMDIECGINYGAYTIAYLDNPNRSEQMASKALYSVTDLTRIFEVLDDINLSYTYNKL